MVLLSLDSAGGDCRGIHFRGVSQRVIGCCKPRTRRGTATRGRERSVGLQAGVLELELFGGFRCPDRSSGDSAGGECRGIHFRGVSQRVVGCCKPRTRRGTATRGRERSVGLQAGVLELELFGGFRCPDRSSGDSAGGECRGIHFQGVSQRVIGCCKSVFNSNGTRKLSSSLSELLETEKPRVHQTNPDRKSFIKFKRGRYVPVPCFCC